MHKLTLYGIALLLCGGAFADSAAPRYKPFSRAPEPIDITINAYGYSTIAPDALKIGDVAPDFQVPSPNGMISLAQLRRSGEVAIIFYRGHW